MKIYYFSPYDIFRARVNQITEMRLCEGFSQNQCNVEFIAPYVFRKFSIRRDRIFSFYGIKKKFKIKILKTPFIDINNGFIKKIQAFILVFFNFINVALIFLKNYNYLSNVVIISRSVDLVIPSIIFKKILRLRKGPVTICWAHEVIFRKRYEWAYRQSDGIIGTNHNIISDLRKKLKIPYDKLTVFINPVTVDNLNVKVDRKKIRRKLGIPDSDRPLIVYTGKLYIGQKEARYILEAASRLPNYIFLFTGGKPHVIRYYKYFCREKKIFNVHFTGFIQDSSQVIYYQLAADVLVSYYTEQDHIVEYNFPQKLTEYMKTGNPIVLPDYPATKDVLNKSNAIIVEPEDLVSLINGIRKGAEDKFISRKVGAKALSDARELTNKKQAKKLLKFVKTL